MEAKQSRVEQIIYDVTNMLSHVKHVALLLVLMPTTSLALEPPKNIWGSVIDGNTIKWEWSTPSQAVRFDVIINNEFVVQTTDSFFFSEGLNPGDYSLVVKAINSDWGYSKTSLPVKYTISSVNNDAEVRSIQPLQAPATITNTQIVDDTGLIDPQSWSQPGVNKEAYELVFSDEFNGNSLSRQRWHSQIRWDGEFNGERYEYRLGADLRDNFYVNIYSEDQEHLDKVVPVFNPFEFDGSRLAIRAIVNPMKDRQKEHQFGPLDQMFGQATFLSGAISTYDKFSQRYGYFEARIKIPNQVGAFPAFWLHHQQRMWEGSRRTEIDIMENLGHAPWYIYTDFHYFNGVSATYGGDPVPVDPFPSGQIGRKDGTDYSKDYHVYAAEWKPGHIDYFIDGVKVSEVKNGNVDYEDLYILLNLAVGGEWTNYPSNVGGLISEDRSRFPMQSDIDNWSNPALEIDYVRAYKRK